MSHKLTSTDIYVVEPTVVRPVDAHNSAAVSDKQVDASLDLVCFDLPGFEVSSFELLGAVPDKQVPVGASLSAAACHNHNHHNKTGGQTLAVVSGTAAAFAAWLAEEFPGLCWCSH